MSELTAQNILHAYMTGMFPMSEGREDTETFWVRPHERGVFLYDQFHVPKRLKRFMRSFDYSIHINRNFPAVIRACATVTDANRDSTWINHDIETQYNILHEMGHVHSFEVYNREDQLIGGLYGLSIGRIFCGESMFSYQTNASKIALVELVNHCKKQGYDFIDAQFTNSHLEQFHIQPMPQNEYEQRLFDGLDTKIQFDK